MSNDDFAEAPKKPSRKRSFSITLIELLQPDGYWPQPLSIEQAFELMRWMVQTGSSDPKYTTQQRWGTCGVCDLLSATSSIGNHSVLPIRSLNDLRRRFHYAVLGKLSSKGQGLWRADFSINPASTIITNSPTYCPFESVEHLTWRSESDIQKALEALLTGSNGTRMSVSLNSCHKESVNWLHGVQIGIHGNRGFSFIIHYGDNSSEWKDTIAHSRPKESFLDTMARARDVFDCLVHGEANSADTTDLFENRSIGADFLKEQIKAIHASSAR